MKNLALVGLGKVSPKYLKGLKESSYQLICVIDILEEPEGFVDYKEYPIYKSIKEASMEHKIDYVLISTPPKTHESIILEALNLNINVLVEKLITLNNENFQKINNLSKEKGLKVITLYHWQYGNEANHVYKHINQKFKSVTTNIYEPYCNSHNILEEEFYNLGGAIVDSLPNILSFYSIFLNLDKLIFENRIDTKDINSNIIITSIKYRYYDALITINIDWTKNKNHKSTNIVLEDSKNILIDHSYPFIESLNKKEDYKTKDRLETHYKNLFTTLELKSYNYINMNTIHKLLFEQIN